MASKTVKAQFADEQTTQLACTYAALILADGGVDVCNTIVLNYKIKATQIEKLIKATGLKVEPFWPKVYEKALKGKNVNDLLAGGSDEAPSSAPVAARAAEAPKVEAKKVVEKGTLIILELFLVPDPEEDMDMNMFGDF